MNMWGVESMQYSVLVSYGGCGSCQVLIGCFRY